MAFESNPDFVAVVVDNGVGFLFVGQHFTIIPIEIAKYSNFTIIHCSFAQLIHNTIPSHPPAIIVTEKRQRIEFIHGVSRNLNRRFG